MNKEDELVSIIVPVYNTEDYLRECIESVLGQSYEYWELFLVDDGSSDGSGLICDKYANADERIHVIHKKNGGISSARNRALDQCRGSYYMFLDSDDRLCDTAVQELYYALKQNDADMSYGGVKKIGKKKSEYMYDISEEKCYDGETACKKMFIEEDLDSNAVAKLYKSELWEGVRFPENKIFEVVPIMYKVLLSCKKVTQCAVCVYEQRSRAGSITRTEFRESMMDYVNFSKIVYEDISANKSELKEYALVYYLIAVIDNYIHISYSTDGKKYKKYRKELWKIIRDSWSMVNKYECLKKLKLRIVVCRLGMGKIAYSIYQKMR